MSTSSARRVARVLAGGLLLLAAGGCSGGGDAVPSGPSASPTPTTLAQLDTRGQQVPRLEFCGLVPEEAVAAALGAEPEQGDAREPGDASFQEVGCSWTAGRGKSQVSARAWVFAQPVTEAVAERAVAEAGERRGCQVGGSFGGSLEAYGDPAVEQTCRTSGGPRVRYAGLQGDTWVTCELQGRGAPARAEAWCTAVLDALLADQDTAGSTD